MFRVSKVRNTGLGDARSSRAGLYTLYILSDSRYFRVSAICKQILDTFDGVSCICRQIVDTLWWGIFYLLADSIYFWQNILDTFRYLADTFEKYLRYYLIYFFETFRKWQKMAFCLRFFMFWCKNKKLEAILLVFCSFKVIEAFSNQ